MWLDSSVNQLLEEGIEPGIKDAGYDPIRIDKTEPLDKMMMQSSLKFDVLVLSWLISPMEIKVCVEASITKQDSPMA